ncbi:MAG TPA: hypothetical protein ENN69_05520 [Spirochaetia bacterium]|nr:hypothetical protein [Spirochaetia bacterium]
MKKRYGDAFPAVSAAGTTGSGRKMIAALFGAETVVNEITAHALAAKRLIPEVDTIIEIGGQDSKLTILTDGEVSFAQMNYVCAAGTGSFIDEQAKRLGMSLDEISRAALRGEAPFTSDRCTVYMERDLALFSGKGWSGDALAAAVLFSVRDNYLSKVVQRTPLGQHIVFQGATARNQALVAAFEEAVGRPIHVSPWCHLTGAYGAALQALTEGKGRSGFVTAADGIEFAEEQCTFCANHCTLLTARADGRKTGWGMKCGREYEERKFAGKEKSPAVMTRYEKRAAALPTFPEHGSRRAVRIALLNGLYNREYNPLWRALLSRLGFSVETIEPGADVLAAGKESVNSDFCAPMIMAHGLARAALEKKVDWIFFPALVNEEEEILKPARFREKTADAYFCYYSQYFPTIQKLLAAHGAGEKLISPLVSFSSIREDDALRTLSGELTFRFPDISEEEIDTAFREATEFFRKSQADYRRKFAPPPPGQIRAVILGRPYVVFDTTLSLSIPAELEKAGVEVVWQDELDLTGAKPTAARPYLDRMHWKYGREILRALAYCAVTPNTFPVYLSCFRCSPDSFLLSYAKEMMQEAGKPFLFLGLDELASPVGYGTRIEAALHAFRTHIRAQKHFAPPSAVPQAEPALAPGDTVLIPYLNRLISRFWSDCFTAAGFKGEVLDTGPEELAAGYAYAHGGECMPAAAIVGGMLKKVRERHLDPASTMLYLPTLCMACNFPQFPILARNAARAAGYPSLKVALINSMLQGDHLPGNLSMRIFEAGVVGSLVYKIYFHIRPYEKLPGSTDRALARAEELLSAAFRTGGDVRAALGEAAEGFRVVERDPEAGKRPRIGILGDFYVKYNQTVNRNLQELIMAEGGELIIPSFTEMTFHYFDVDVRLFGESERHLKILRMFESRYEKAVADLIDGLEEPDWNDCVQALTDYGVTHYIPGETSLTIARALYYLTRKTVDAIVHINPMFCCPGVVSASLLKKISADFHVPVIDIFYDGTGEPNHILRPHLHYLGARRRREG